MAGRTIHSLLLCVPLLVPLSACHTAIEKPNAVSESHAAIAIHSLRGATRSSSLVREKKLASGSKRYSSELFSYRSDGLKVYALLNRPTGLIPEKGHPVIIFGHGFHPKPRDYGISKVDGTRRRPGDYYRGVPEAYAERGFVVFTPDYRGHGDSEGYQYTRTSYLAAGYYAIDVLNLLVALSDIKNIDLQRVFYVGHSMGGDVGLRVLLATEKIRAASLWSPVLASTYQQALFYGRTENGDDAITPEDMARYIRPVATHLGPAKTARVLRAIDPIHYAVDLSQPLIIHHAIGDASVPFAWSESFVAKLAETDTQFAFFIYSGGDHLFQGDDRQRAVDRDVQFFFRVSRASQ